MARYGTESVTTSGVLPRQGSCQDEESPILRQTMSVVSWWCAARIHRACRARPYNFIILAPVSLNLSTQPMTRWETMPYINIHEGSHT